MGLLRRDRGKKSEQAIPSDKTVPTPAASEGKSGKAQKAGGGGLFGGIRQYIVDSYNGLYKIVLEPSMPTKQTVVLLVVGLIIGLIWGYMIVPTEFYGGSPNRLNQNAQNQWIKSVAVAHDTSTFYGDDRVRELLRAVPDPAGSITAMLQNPGTDAADQQALRSIESIAASIPATDAAAPVTPSLVTDLATGLIIPLLIVVIVTPILAVAWRLLIQPNVAAPIVDRFKRATNPEYRAQKEKQIAELKRIKEQKRIGKELQLQQDKESKASDLGPPVKSSVFIYSKGRNFDESTEIELESGEFLGQCGAVIAEAVEPDPVAVEVWLFDMFSQQNLRRAFITETAYANPSIRARVEDTMDNPAQDVIVAQPGATITLESDKLTLQAKLPSVTVGADGRFDGFQMMVQAWQKDAKKVGAPAAMPAMPPMPAPQPAMRPMSDYDDLSFDPPPLPAQQRPAAPAPMPAARPMSDYDDLAFDPPPMMPQRPSAPPPQPAARPMSDYDDLTFDPPPAPPGGGFKPMQPLQPPPMTTMPKPPGFDDDDPFGGTGDFTPLGSGN